MLILQQCCSNRRFFTVYSQKNKWPFSILEVWQIVYEFLYVRTDWKNYIVSIICINYVTSMEIAWKVILLWRFHGKINMEIVW